MPPSRASRLQLHLLGEMQVVVDGMPLSGKVYGKLLALLAFLAVEGNRGHSRARLAEFFWPGLALEAARNNLRQTLYNLRRALREDNAFLATGRDTVRFLSDTSHWLDLHAFTTPASVCSSAPTAAHCAACLTGMERRAALYRGEFLAGIAVDDAPEFEDWRAGWRDALHRQALALLERLRQCHEHQGSLDRALHHARRYTELEPWDEEGHRQVMRLLAVSGQRGAALAQYEACRVMLEQELAVPPEAETQQLFARIRDGALGRAPVAAPQAPAPESIPLMPRERRLVTVLYCCFAVTGEDDPDEVAECLRAPHQRAIDIVRQQGAHLAPTHGGSILAFFGYPSASEDAARRAVRSALALARARMQGVSVRLGVHTGIIVTGSDPRQPDTVGVASKVAMRLCDRAAAGDVVISDATHRLVAGYFHETTLEPQRLAETSDPIRTFRVTGETGATGRVDVASRLVPFVGRRLELDTLKSLWRETWGGRGGHVVLRGDAGMGKSRLLHALRESLAGVPWSIREIHCFEEYSQTPLYPVIKHLERLLAYDADETPAAKRDVLWAYLTTYHPAFRDEGCGLLAHLLGIAEAPAALPPEMLKEKGIELLLKLMGDAAMQQPLLLAVEDLHWADPSTLALLEIAAKHAGGAPILSVYTTRTEPPRWLADNCVLLELEPLSPEEITALVHEAETELPPETVSRIVARADGVPLFAEEMAHMAVEPAAGTEIPASLHYLLLARLDALGDARRIAQLAATIGREFDRELLRHVADISNEALVHALRGLQEARMVFAAGQSGTRFQFRHALIQEAAFQSQTKVDRQAAHRRVAEALATQFPARAANCPAQVARHYSAADASAEALPWWLAAGRRALQALANAEAIDHLRAGLGLIEKLPPSRQRDNLELDLLLPLGQAKLRLRGYGSADAATIYERARILCDHAHPTQHFETLWGLWMVSSSRADSGFAESAELARALLAIAQDTGNPVLLSYANSSAANVALWQGELEAACRYAETAIAASTESQRRDQRLDGHDPCVASLAYVSWARFAQGRMRDAVEASEHAIAIARRLEQPDSLGFALVHAATLRRYLRDLSAVATLSQETLALATRYGLPLWQGAAAMLMGWAKVAGGDPTGLEVLKTSTLGVRQVMPGILGAFLHPLAEAYGFVDDAEAQLQTADEALQTAERLHERFHLADLYRLRGEALARKGRLGEAIASLREALQVSRSQGARAFELRAALPLVSLLQAQGRRREAAEILQVARAGWDPGEEFADWRMARA